MRLPERLVKQLPKSLQAVGVEVTAWETHLPGYHYRDAEGKEIIEARRIELFFCRRGLSRAVLKLEIRRHVGEFDYGVTVWSPIWAKIWSGHFRQCICGVVASLCESA